MAELMLNRLIILVIAILVIPVVLTLAAPWKDTGIRYYNEISDRIEGHTEPKALNAASCDQMALLDSENEFMYYFTSTIFICGEKKDINVQYGSQSYSYKYYYYEDEITLNTNEADCEGWGAGCIEVKAKDLMTSGNTEWNVGGLVSDTYDKSYYITTPAGYLSASTVELTTNKLAVESRYEKELDWHTPAIYAAYPTKAQRDSDNKQVQCRASFGPNNCLFANGEYKVKKFYKREWWYNSDPSDVTTEDFNTLLLTPI